MAAQAEEEVLFENSDSVIVVSNLKDTIADVLLTGATVTARVLDSGGSPVSGVADPLTLTEIVSSNGLYRGTIPDTASLSDGDTGTIVVTADGGAGLQRVWTIPYVVRNF